MSNLGGYQTMTRLAKAVGGPKALAAIAVGTGALIGWGVNAGQQRVRKIISSVHEKKLLAEAPLHTVTEEAGPDGADAGGGLVLRAGDRFRVLESDGDAILIAVDGDTNNPYFASAGLLASVSDFTA